MNRPIRILVALLCCISAAGVSCRRQAEVAPEAEEMEPMPQRVFAARGQVVKIDLEQREVHIKHDEIPGYMGAMTMPFEVKNTNELAGLSPGDTVTFRLTVTGTDGWIQQVRKTAAGTLSETPLTNSLMGQTGEVELLEVGEVMPAYSFTNQLGKRFSTKDFRGKALAITFIFTRCPYPTFCPRMSGHFAAVQASLQAMKSPPKNWHLLSLSFDPEFDTPPVLKTYAESQKYDPSHWTFGTGRLVDVATIGQNFGLLFWRDEKGGISHNLRTVLIDPKGKVRRIFDGNEWSSRELIDEMVAATQER